MRRRGHKGGNRRELTEVGTDQNFEISPRSEEKRGGESATMNGYCGGNSEEGRNRGGW